MAFHSPIQIPSCPGFRSKLPALPVAARPPVLRRGHGGAQRELPLHPRR